MAFKNAYVLVFLNQCVAAGVILLSKAAYDRGFNIYVFVFYRQLLASLFLLPFSIFFEWKSSPPLSIPIFCKIFGLALVAFTMALNLYGFGLKFTSSTIGAATYNCVPALTIAFAVVLRMEEVNIRKRVGLAKSVGILLCMAGVAVLAFYKGPYIKSPVKNHPFNPSHSSPKGQDHGSSTGKWIEGCLFCFILITAGSLGIVLQGKLMKSYPSKLIFTNILCFSSAIQSLFVAVAVERDPSKWKLGWNFKLLVVLYCGIMGSGILYYLQALVIDMKGPVFFAMFTPLNLIITIILGGVLLVGSLYSVLWAKRAEEEEHKVVTANANAKAKAETILIQKQCPNKGTKEELPV